MQRTKTDWRRELLDARGQLDADLRRAHAAAIVDRVAALPELATARALLLYVPIGAEADVRAIAALPAPPGPQVYVPGAVPGTWTHYAIGGRPDAPETGTATLASPVVVLVPGVAFDGRGVRLGRGRGFYDRAVGLLRRHATVLVVGIGFELQIVSQLPQDPWDQPVDLVVTEQRLLVPLSDDAGAAHNPGQEVRDS